MDAWAEDETGLKDTEVFIEDLEEGLRRMQRQELAAIDPGTLIPVYD
jgi:hypothetical protein